MPVLSPVEGLPRRLRALAVVAGTLAATVPLAARADERTQEERLAAIAAQLKDPAGFRACYKLVDAGPGAIDDLLNALGASPLADERIEACLREIARTKDGAKQTILKLGQAARPATRARLARALAQAGVVDAVYPLVDALDFPQEALEVSTFGPHGGPARETSRVARPVSVATAAFGERAAAAIRKRLQTTRSSLFVVEAEATLGLIKSVESVPLLVTLAASEDRTASERAMALTALAAIGDARAKDAFSRALASDDAGVRRAALRGLAVIPDPSAVPQVARMLEEEKEDDLRLDEVRALGASEDTLAEGPLEAALDKASSAGESVRARLVQECVAGMARSGGRGASAALVRALEKGQGFQVDRGIAQGLARIPDLGIDPREQLRSIVSEKKTGETTRACAAWVLALRGEDEHLAALMALARSKESAVRACVATLLGEGKLEGSVAALVALCKDEEPRVRRAAVAALGRSEGSTAGAALLSVAALAKDADPVVRRLYASAFEDALPQGTLDKDQRKPAATILGRALEVDLPAATLEERRAEARTIARLGERAALLRVASGTLLATPPPIESRRAAIEVLAVMGRHEATEDALSGIVRDPGVGDDAALALAKIRGETFFEAKWRELLAPAAPFH